MQLLRADPLHVHRRHQAFPSKADHALSAALIKGCVMLFSGRLQGCIESQTQEFLERIDQSGIVVDLLPESLRAALCSQYFGGKSRLKPAETAELHQRYAVLWTPGAMLPSGTLRTDSLPDKSGNPWPSRVATLMRRCDIDLFGDLEHQRGKRYRDAMTTYVDELIDMRNNVAHGSPVTAWTTADLVLRMQWACRMAHACDQALGDKLLTITGSSWDEA